MRALGLRSKLSIPFIVGIILAYILVQLFLEPEWKKRVLEDVKTDQKMIISALEPDLTRHLLVKDYAALYATLDTQLDEKDSWLNLRLVLPDGSQLYPLDEVNIAEVHTHVFTIEQDLWIAGESIATVYLVVDWSARWQDMQASILKFEGYIMAIFVAVVVMAYLLLNSMVRKPIIALERSVAKIAQGRYTEELPKSDANDEIGKLSRSFNEMVHELIQSNNGLNDALMVAENERIRVKTILEAIADGIIVTDSSGIILSVNPAAEKMFGFSQEESVGQPVDIFIPMSNRATHGHKVKAFSSTENNSLELGRDVFAARKNGKQFPVKISVNRMVLNDESLFVSVVRDITEEKSIESVLKVSQQKAMAASQAKSDFLAKMSHEIRTPMNGVLGVSQLLAKSELNDRQRSQLELIMESGKSLLGIINDILDLSKIESGSMTLESVALDLKGIATDVVDMFLPKCHEKGVEIVLDYDDALTPHLYGDPLRLKQCLLNLVSNSIKFTDSGQILVGIKQERDDKERVELSIRVKDSGIGISNDIQEKLFESFVQADDSTTRKYGGTGLGLAITKQLVELMGGTIKLNSEEGVGSEFRIYLTLRAIEAVASGDKQAMEEPVLPRLSKLSGNILFAEDVEVNQFIVKSMLEDRGAKVDIAIDGFDALEKMKTQSYDIVLMDCQMPNMDGFEASRIIRNDLSKSIPIIAVTADAYEDNKERCTAAGMNDFVSKPFDESELVEVVTKWMRRARAS